MKKAVRASAYALTLSMPDCGKCRYVQPFSYLLVPLVRGLLNFLFPGFYTGHIRFYGSPEGPFYTSVLRELPSFHPSILLSFYPFILLFFYSSILPFMPTHAHSIALAA